MIAVQFPLDTMGGKSKDQLIAVIDGWKWASKNKKLEEYLNAMLDPDGPGGEIPQPEMRAATEAIKMLGGKIIKEDQGAPPPPNSVQ